MQKQNRETWLNAMAEKFRPLFLEYGFPLPSFRVSTGFTSKGKDKSIAGQCWSKENSKDKHFEIFISPHYDDTREIVNTLVHELVHAAVGLDQGHTGNFAKLCLKFGMQRPMTSTPSGPRFIKLIDPFIDELGSYPHASLM